MTTTGITEVTIARTIVKMRREIGTLPTAAQVASRMVPEAPARRRKAWNAVYNYVAEQVPAQLAA